MADAQEYIRLDYKEKGRFINFPNDLLLAASNLLPQTELEIVCDNTNGTETTEAVPAKSLHSQKMVRTIVMPTQNLGDSFLSKLLNEGPLTTQNVVVTGFTRVKSWGGVADVHNPSFTLTEYVNRDPESVVSLQRAAHTKFQDPKANVFDRFFGSKTGTIATLVTIIAGAGYLHFKALSEQQAPQQQPPQAAASVHNEVAQQAQIQK